jgi:hypothetical protein
MNREGLRGSWGEEMRKLWASKPLGHRFDGTKVDERQSVES